MARKPQGRTRNVRIGDEVVTVSAPSKGEHGTMVEQSAEARAASRGAVGGTMLENMLAREKYINSGVSPGGDTPDGTTRTGIPQEDDLRAAEPAQPNTLPQDTGLVKVAEGVEGPIAGKAPAGAMSPADAQRKRDADAAAAKAEVAKREAEAAQAKADATKKR